MDPLVASVNPLLQQSLKPRHLNMIAMGGSIGTGLFVGVGQGECSEERAPKPSLTSVLRPPALRNGG